MPMSTHGLYTEKRCYGDLTRCTQRSQLLLTSSELPAKKAAMRHSCAWMSPCWLATSLVICADNMLNTR